MSLYYNIQMDFDLQDLSILFCTDTIMELEKTVYQEEPSLPEIIWPDNEAFAQSMKQYLFTHDITFANTTRLAHPMHMIGIAPESMRQLFATHIVSQSSTDEVVQDITYKFLMHYPVFRDALIRYVEDYSDAWPDAYKALRYLCNDVYSFLLAGFCPDFIEGSFWDILPEHIEDDIMTVVNCFLLECNRKLRED